MTVQKNRLFFHAKNPPVDGLDVWTISISVCLGHALRTLDLANSSAWRPFVPRRASFRPENSMQRWGLPGEVLPNCEILVLT